MSVTTVQALAARAARWLPVLALAAAAGLAVAQQPPTSPAAAAEAAQPMRVVCIADSPEAFLNDETFRDRVLARLPAALPAATGAAPAARLRGLIAPLGRRFIVPVGSGFVVDSARRHVVTNWHVATACGGERSAGRQIAVVVSTGTDIVALQAERLPDRSFQDTGGLAVKLVQAVCRDPQQPCGADLPRAADDKPLPEAARRKQLDNLLAYAPDIAVLRLGTAAKVAPLALALNQQLDDQMRLVIRAFGPVPVGVGEADAAARLHLVAPVSVAAVYTGPQQISQLPPGGQPGEEIHVKLHRLAAAVQPVQSGAPVLRGAGVVGLLTAPPEPGRVVADGAAPTTYAVPVTVLAVFLDLIKVPYISVPPDQPAARVQAAVAPAVPVAAPPPPRRWWEEPQSLMLAGALALALLAGVAFFLLWRRPAASPSVRSQPRMPTASLPQRTVSRPHQPTMLHAVAMPTSALDPPTTIPQPLPDADDPANQTATGISPRLPPPPAGVHLHCAAGPLAPLMFSLPMPNGGTTLFVGRDSKSCQVVFPPSMDQISGVHACFMWDPPSHRLTVRDISSSGTWVNGQRIAKGRTVPLDGGDEVDLGGPSINRFRIELVADLPPVPDVE